MNAAVRHLAILALLVFASCRRERQENIQPLAPAERGDAAPDAAPTGAIVVARQPHFGGIRFLGAERLAMVADGAIVTINLAPPFGRAKVANIAAGRKLAAFNGDGASLVWVVFDERAPEAAAEVWLADAGGSARRIGAFGGPPALSTRTIELDAREVYVLRGWPEYSLEPPHRDRQLLAFPRSGGTARVVVAAPGPNAFALDDDHVYWTEGMGGPQSIFRAPKKGGAKALLAEATGSRLMFVFDRAVYVRDEGGTVRTIPAAGGATAVAADAYGESYAVDRHGYCWAKAETISCRTTTKATTFSAAGSIVAMAISPTRVAFTTAVGEGDARIETLWLAPRPAR